MVGLEHYLTAAAALFVIGRFPNRQNVLQQMWRDPQKAMELKDVKPGQGL